MSKSLAALTGSVVIGSVGTVAAAADGEPLFRADPLESVPRTRAFARASPVAEARCGEGKCADDLPAEGKCGEGLCGAPSPDPMACVAVGTKTVDFFHPRGAKRMPVVKSSCPYTVRVDIAWDLSRVVDRPVEGNCGEGKCGAVPAPVRRVSMTIMPRTERDLFFVGPKHARAPYRWVACRHTPSRSQSWRSRPCTR